MSLRVNRYLRNEAMDHIDHALGRPLDPMAESYRNNFATASGGVDDEAFAASPHWSLVRRDIILAHYSVTPEGRRALRDYLTEIGEPHRAYVVRFDGYDMPVVSTSPSKARYSHYRTVSDIWPDLTFAEFMRSASVRVASLSPRAAQHRGA